MDDPIAHAEHLIGKAEDLDNRISQQTETVILELVTYKSKAVKWQAFTLGLLVLTIAMLIVGLFSIVKIRDNAASIQAICEATNKVNANQIILWDFLLKIPPEPTETDTQKTTRIEFADLVQRTFVQQDCSQPRVIP